MQKFVMLAALLGAAIGATLCLARAERHKRRRAMVETFQYR